MSCFFSDSAILVYLQACWGVPFLCFPCGFHYMALLAMYPSGVLSMCQALCLTYLSPYWLLPYWLLACLSPKLFIAYSSRPPILLHALIALKLLQLLLQSFCQSPSFRTTQGTTFIFESKTLNLLIVVFAVPQLCNWQLRPLNACLDALISASLLAQTHSSNLLNAQHHM